MPKANVTNFNFDPDILNDEHNETRLQRVPSATVVSKDEDCGIFIPVEALSDMGWRGDVDIRPFKVTKTAQPSEGLFLKSAKMLILAATPPYIQIKKRDENKEEAGQFIGWFHLDRAIFDKNRMDVACEYLLLFLDNENKPFHDKPIKARFRNTAYWKFKITLDKIYAAAEGSFAVLTNTKRSAKSDKWRSLVVVSVDFEPQVVGEAPKQSNVCGIGKYAEPNVESFPNLFLGSSEQKNKVWGLADIYSTFTNILEIPRQLQMVDQRQQPRLVAAVVDDSDLVF
jgi:hypothetical protein